MADIATIIAALVAVIALGRWRKQAKANRIADAAIDLMSHVNDFATKLRAARIGTVEAGDLTYKGRLEELDKISTIELFGSVTLIKALCGDLGLQASINKLTKVKFDLKAILAKILCAVERGDNAEHLKLHSSFFAVDPDEANNRKISEAIDELEEILHPLIRLEKGKKA
jgi:outer membrane murein-binding lipoprotein Lpp